MTNNLKFKLQEKKFIAGKTKITYGAVIFGKEEKEAAMKVFERNWWVIDYEGEEFEKELAKFVGKKYCVLTNSGSSALLLSFASLGLKPGTGVVIPAVTFPTAFSALVLNRLTPYVVDVDKQTLNLDLSETEKALKIGAKAILAVHIAGNPVDMVALSELAKKYQAKIIEDNCDGLGSDINGKMVGSFGDISCTSLYAGHIISIGEGGAVFTDDVKIASKVRSLRDWGRAAENDNRGKYKDLPQDYPSRYTYTEIGYNLRPLELQAAIGRVQLNKIGFIKNKRQENFAKLTKIFQDKPGITLLKPIKGANPCWFSFPFLSENRTDLINHLERANIETRPIFAGNILKQPGFKNVKVKKISSCSQADEVLFKGLFVGLHPLIPDQAFSYIEETINKYFNSK